MRRARPIIALIALVAVLAVGFAGYRALGARLADAEPGASAITEPGGAAEPDAAADASADGGTERGPMLADHDATVYTADGEAVTLAQLADGTPLVINFWATWCPYCVEELPDFQELVRDYDGRVAFAFIDAADGERETVETASAWITENGFSGLPVYYDTGYDAVYAYGVRAFPTTVLVSADGEILAVQSGMIDPVLMRNALDSLV